MHLQLFRFVSNGDNQPALVRLAGHHSRSTVPTSQQSVPTVESQAPFERIGLSGMTLEAVLRENRADSLFEEFLVRSLIRAQGGGEKEDEQNQLARPHESQFNRDSA